MKTPWSVSRGVLIWTDYGSILCSTGLVNTAGALTLWVHRKQLKTMRKLDLRFLLAVYLHSPALFRTYQEGLLVSCEEKLKSLLRRVWFLMASANLSNPTSLKPHMVLVWMQRGIKITS